MNDNQSPELAATIKSLETMEPMDKLTLFLSLIENGVEVNTAFVKNEDTDVFTHQLIRISCGDYATLSQPEMLNTPLRAATGAETNQTVN